MNSAAKKRELQWRIFRYGVTVVSVVGLTIVLFFAMMGFRYNKNSGTVEQGGLVHFVSQPTGAQVTVGPALLANKTQSKITLYPGDYAVTMQRDGYRAWRKNVTVTVGEVLWLNSARLIPTQPVTETVHAQEKLDQVVMAESGKQAMLVADKTQPRLQTAVLTDGKFGVVKELLLPESTYSPGETHVFTAVQWSPDNRHVIVEHSFNDKKEVLLVDTSAVEKTVKFLPNDDVTPVEVLVDPRDDGNLIARYSDGSVRLLNGGDGSISTPLITRTSSISLSDNAIYYVLDAVDGAVVTGYVTLGTTTPKTLATHKTSEPVRIMPGHYFSEYFTMTVIGTKATIEKYTLLPSSDAEDVAAAKTVAQFTAASAPVDVQSRYDGRFFTLETPTAVTVYDLELDKKYDTNLSATAGATSPIWFDGQHFGTAGTGMLRMTEYDGTNQYDIVRVTPGYDAMFTPSGRYLYSVIATESGMALQRTKIILN